VTAGNVANVRDNLVSHPVHVIPETLRTTCSFPEIPSSISLPRTVLPLSSRISCITGFSTLQQDLTPAVQQDDSALQDSSAHTEVEVIRGAFSSQQASAQEGS
jgi:hypothetical protein